MNILQVHNKYKILGGEWTVLQQEYELLKNTHAVEQFIVDNAKELSTVIDKLKLVFKTHYNKKAKKKLFDKLTGGNYDVMHTHNFFPLLSPSVFEAAREAGVPSILSLHNFRLIHPNGLLYHNGKIDHRSIGGSAYNCVWDGVYRNSKVQTAVAAHMIEYHRKHNTWQTFPSAFIALSEFSKQMFVDGGLPEERIFIKPNFIEDPLNNGSGLAIQDKKENMFLFVGRISTEKGIQDLIECWIQHKIKAKLVVAGDGPLREKLEKKSKANPSIQWLGQISREEILQKLTFAKAMLFPTRCYEGQPLIILEALSVGCPVITSKIGNPQNMIDDGVNGLHFKTGDINDMYSKISAIYYKTEKRKEMSKNARESYLNRYTPEKNSEMLMDIYKEAAKLEKKLSA